MLGLITDRTRENVLRRNELAAKGFANMTSAEKAEWLGDPMATAGANLLPPGPYYSSSVALKYRSDSIVATATGEGIYLYAISIIGEATKYEGKTFTLSVDKIETVGGGLPQIALYWHDDNGFEYAGASLMGAGTVTFTMSENTNNRANLATYIYVTTDATVTAGATATFHGVMLEIGSVRHEYVPYTEVVATNATKGAYNYSDLNRVERAVAEISDDLGLGLTTKTDWTMWDVPRVSDWTRYIDNVKAIRTAYGRDIALPEVGDKLTYSVANNIEIILANKREWRKYSCDVETVTDNIYAKNTASGETKTFTAWFVQVHGAYYFSSYYGFQGSMGTSETYYTVDEVNSGELVGKYRVYEEEVWEIVSVDEVKEGYNHPLSLAFTAKLIDECEIVSSKTYDVYSQGDTSYGTIETFGEALPEEGTIIEGSISEGYYVLQIGSNYYYYRLA